jgi:hypothetical protein
LEQLASAARCRSCLGEEVHGGAPAARQSYPNFLSSEKGGCDFRFWPFRTWVPTLTMSARGGKADLAVTNADFRN